MDTSPGSEPLDFLLAQISRLHFTRAHKLLENLGLYRGQPPVLRILWEQEGLTHTELADRLHITPATMTKMLQRMKKAGFLISKPDPVDRRVSRVYLTQAGRIVQDRVFQVWKTMEEDEFSNFSEDELVLIRKYLTRIRDNIAEAIGDKSPF